MEKQNKFRFEFDLVTGPGKSGGPMPSEKALDEVISDLEPAFLMLLNEASFQYGEFSEVKTILQIEVSKGSTDQGATPGG